MEKFNDKEILRKLGANIRSIRKSKGLTLDDASVHSGVDTSDIGKIERGEINISFSTLYKLAKGLDTKLTELVNFEL